MLYGFISAHLSRTCLDHISLQDEKGGKNMKYYFALIFILYIFNIYYIYRI